VVEVISLATPEHRNGRLIDASVEADRTAAGAERQPVEVDAVRAWRR